LSARLAKASDWALLSVSVALASLLLGARAAGIR
jgi:hypothetical protein